MIEILKASAGSGKTYNLAKTYIRLLLSGEDPYAYRHILAVTFTNKATDEMKSRIIAELYKLAGNPGESSYAKDFVPSVCPTLESLGERAREALRRILHDYGSFSVSTIDRFFQRTLKAFAREIGQFASYQVELDKDSIVEESVERVLDSLDPSQKALLDWLSDSALEQLEQGKRYDLAAGLTEMAKRLKSDEHRDVVEKFGVDEETAYSKENLKNMKKVFREAMSSYVRDLKEAAVAVERAFEANGISTYDTSRSFLGKTLAKFSGLSPRSSIPPLTDSFRKNCADYETWFKKADKERLAPFEGALMPSVTAFVSVYDAGVKIYNTAKILEGQVNDLGIASELSREFREVSKDRNVLCIDDSNQLLKGIIDGSDAPFVYEKIGVRYDHYLLDEFQDTSRIQWDNFKPLVRDSEAQGNENLVVGDVKQSIYRWRGSDWDLMASEVPAEFPQAKVSSLKGNWRSLRGIVEFNNGFFAYASSYVDSENGPCEGATVSGIYGAVDGTLTQSVDGKDPEEGSVEAVFCEADEELEKTLECVRKVMDAGASLRDITILVRNNGDGSAVAEYLIANGIDVISDDSLCLKSSLVVRKIVSLVSSVNDSSDTVSSYIAKESGIEVKGLSFHSLLDLCETLLREIRDKDGEELVEDEILYVQSFMDYVRDFSVGGGNSPDAFLKAWELANPKLSSPSDVEAVRVMTIHKSKGLEFPYVIFPFAERIQMYRRGNRWIVPEVEGSALDGIGKAAFDVELNSGSADSLFDADFAKESFLQHVDNINTFYVALTRPSKGITIISKKDEKPGNSFAGVLNAYLEDGAEGFTRTEEDGSVCFRKGSLYDFSKLERKVSGAVARVPGYPSFPLNPDGAKERGRLRLGSDSFDFFTEEGRKRGGARRNGVVLHGILASVVVPSDLPAAVEAAVRAGDLEAETAKEELAFLGERISRHPEWFPESGAEIFSEVTLIDSDGKEYRPDRVIVRGGSVTVLDYKFGSRDSRYARQVARYADIYHRMGYQDVSTAIWYVEADEVD